MKESDLQNDIMCVLGAHPKVAWCFVTTTGKVRSKGYWITLGFPGMTDIIGQLTSGRLLAIEVKLPGETPTKIQFDFMDMVDRHGGLAGWTDSIEGALKILEAA